MEDPNGTTEAWLRFLLCCQPARAEGHSWDGRGTTVPHRCQLWTRHGWGARDVAGSILSLGAGSVPFPPRCVMTGSTAQRCPWPRQLGPSTFSLPCVPQTTPSTIQKTWRSPLSPGPPRATPSPTVLLHQLGASCLLLQLRSHRCSINIRVTPAHIRLIQVSELQSHRPAFRLIILYRALKTEFYFYCNDPVVLPDPSVEET